MKQKMDRSFYLHLLAQGISAMIFMFFVLISLDAVGAQNLIWAAGASTLAASSFLVFATPHAEYAKFHRIIIGYVIAMLCGYLIRFLVAHLCQAWVICLNPLNKELIFEVAAVIALGLSFFLMILLQSAHPPAAGLSIVMVLEISNFNQALVILAGALVLSLSHLFFNRVMRPLV